MTGVVYKVDRAFITIATAITEESMIGLVHEIDRLCPVAPDLPKATQVRPPSSLRPGECYAVVTDGRFLRCRIDLDATPANECSGAA